MRHFKTFLLTLFTIGTVALGFTQPKNAVFIDTNNVMSFFSEQYGDETKEIYQSNPEIVDEMKTFLETKIYLIQNRKKPNHVTTKLSSFPVISKHSYDHKEFSPKNFNPFKYGLHQLNEKKIIHIDNTNYVVIVEPNN